MSAKPTLESSCGTFLLVALWYISGVGFSVTLKRSYDPEAQSNLLSLTSAQIIVGACVTSTLVARRIGTRSLLLLAQRRALLPLQTHLLKTAVARQQ